MFNNILNKSIESRGVFSQLHAPSIFRSLCYTVSDWVGSLSNSNAAGTNGCLDFSCRSCPQSFLIAIFHRMSLNGFENHHVLI